MNQKELKELIEFLIEKDIAEFELERGDVKVRIKRGSEPVVSASVPDPAFSLSIRRRLRPRSRRCPCVNRPGSSPLPKSIPRPKKDCTSCAPPL